MEISATGFNSNHVASEAAACSIIASVASKRLRLRSISAVECAQYSLNRKRIGLLKDCADTLIQVASARGFEGIFLYADGW
jgi:hypothetical protein